jgi:hypothetical protein
MRSASPRVVLLVAALLSFRPVKAAVAGALPADQAALRVMISVAVAWVLVGALTGVSRSFLLHHEDDAPQKSEDQS